MSRPIDADALMRAMYHRAFETDGDTMWQSGCWVRYRAIEQTVEEQPTIEPEKHTEERTETHACDLIDREAAVDAIYHHLPSVSRTEVRLMLHEVPSARPEPLSDAYMKSVWTWLLEYQINVAKLKGRYTPYEVLSWVANDWRKEHE